MNNRHLNHMRDVDCQDSVYDLMSVGLDAGMALVSKPSCVGC